MADDILTKNPLNISAQQYLKLPSEAPTPVQEFIDYVKKVPPENHPSIKRRVLAGIGGALGGYQAGKDILMSPQTQQMQQYNTQAGALGRAAQIQQQQELQNSQISELGQRKLMEAANTARYGALQHKAEYESTPDYTERTHPRAIGASIGAGGYLKFGQGGQPDTVTPPAGGGAGTFHNLGQGNYLENGVLKKAPWNQPYRVGEAEKKRLMDHAAGLKVGKPLTIQDEQRLRQQAIAKVYSTNPDLQGHITTAGGKLVIAAPKSHWYGDDTEEVNKATTAVEAEYQRLLEEHRQGRNQAIDKASQEDYSGYTAEEADQ